MWHWKNNLSPCPSKLLSQILSSRKTQGTNLNHPSNLKDTDDVMIARWSSWCVGWDWSIGCRLMFFGIRWVLLWRSKIIQSRLRWYGHVILRDINSHIREVMELEITGKRKKGRPRKSWEKCVKDLDWYDLTREDTYDWEKWRERIKAKIANSGQPG